MARKRYVGARQNHGCTVIAAHGIERDTNPIRHGSLLTASIAGPAARSCEVGARAGPWPLVHPTQTDYALRSCPLPASSEVIRQAVFLALPEQRTVSHYHRWV